MSETEQEKKEVAEQQPAPAEQRDTQDKKEIAEEEREKMLNAENSKHSAAAPQTDLEAEERKPKRKIPIGAIKMPGFCRSRSKEPCKEDESQLGENADGEAAKGGAAAATATNLDSAGDKAANGGTPVKEPPGAAARGGRILEAIRLPLVNVGRVFTLKRKENDTELSQAGPGAASAEAADDEKANTVGEDGMETVRLDVETADSGPLAKPHALALCVVAARRNLLYTAGAAAVLLLLLVIVCVASLGPRRVIAQPVKDGKVLTQASCGPVQGLLEEGAFVFRGVPYAMPPLGERRWAPPEPLDKIDRCWNGTLLAHNSSQPCWQRRRDGSLSGHEDCLYLDIYTPQVTYERPLSVVVMIGADSLSGPSPGIMLPSGKLARVRDMVFVRPNFRLDVFGFLALEPLSRTVHPATSGNYGLHDIKSVLKWVALNIHHFGGDKDKVTVWGHRAGGTLVTALVGARRPDEPLFQRAWISSGSISFPTLERVEAEKDNGVFLDITKCRDAACLKNLDARELMGMVPPAWFLPNDGLPKISELTSRKHHWLIKDEVVIQHHIGSIFAQNNGDNRLPLPKIVMGTTAQSGQLPDDFNYNATYPNTTVIRAFLDSLLGTAADADRAFAQYNATVKGLHTLISDIRVTCPLMTLATARNDIPFYIVTFPRDLIADVDSDAAAILGFFPMKTAEQKRHLAAIQTLFSHFVYHGEVEKFEASKRILIVDQDVLPKAGYDNCKLWIEKSLVPNLARVD
ncbi:neurotactin [Phymastichus coffea]|uniref:neurotactin n=1 Tax=Phymastichus coffea TaxID=108790 RepID=UPI00273AEA74|nr:neurotactin [Phymastichus coffea]XP_058798695.1 neurotactin [Phymastichus coffea]XP_058798696.1 neurotactin [Phymastichus coffea]XP_058798697.1 neurotactin [Phymastichus coffea]